MKKVKTVLMVIALQIGLSIPQVANAQKRKVTLEDISLLKELGVEKNSIDVLSKVANTPNVDWDLGDFDIDEYIKKMMIRKKSLEIVNLTGKWVLENNNKSFVEYNTDNTMIDRIYQGKEFTVEGSDITYPLEATVLHYNWKKDGYEITITPIPESKEYILGDISFYPADIQKRIKEDIKARKEIYIKESHDEEHFIIHFISPDSLKLSQRKGEWRTYVHDISNMNAQQKIEYNKEKEKWNKIKKGVDQEVYLAALERDNLEMAKLKVKAIASGKQHDYWIIGHMYEYGEGNDGMKTTICLDSALVWYKKAATIDPKYERYVTAVSHKIKTGRDYYEDEAKSEIEGKKKQIAQARATYTKKYGATNSNYLSKQGIVAKGMSIAFIREYINDFNQIGIPSMGTNVRLTLKEYKPTERDMMQYGRTVKSYKLFSNGLAWGDGAIWSFLVLNGKVVSSSKLSVGYEGISMERDWNDK